MAQMIALLRGINVGGHNKVSMKDLSGLFVSLGCANVRTLLITGNVLFDAPDGIADLRSVIERGIEERLGFSAAVIVLSVDALRAAASRDPFRGKTASDSVKLYLAVLCADPRKEPSLPCFTPTKEGDVEIVSRDGLLVFTAGYEKDGRFGFPNAVVEKAYGVPATSRNWNTIEKLLEMST